MVRLKRDGNQYVYKNYSISHAIDGRWYVWEMHRIVADFPTLREVRDWLYKQEEE